MQQNDFIYMERLLERHNADVRNVILDQGMYIQAVVISDCPNCVSELVKNGADPNAPYFGQKKLTHHIWEVDEILKITGYAPLMRAVAIGSKRCVDALLESPLIEVTRGVKNDKFETARKVAKCIKDVKERSLYLKTASCSSC